MPKHWEIKKDPPKEISERLAKILKNSPLAQKVHSGEGGILTSGNFSLLVQMLFNRGLSNEKEIDDFLHPDYEKLASPFLFGDMRKAAQRICKAIESGEKICVYGDYDADAVTASAVVLQTLRALNAKAESYIPDRFSEGYGVNLQALEKIKEQGQTLIITVDCGTNSTDAAKWCLENEIDFIITDHHEIIGPAPLAFCLINPKNPNDNYPDKNITGVGVAFKLACAVLLIAHEQGFKTSLPSGWEKWLLDLVAIGTVADCHELLGENRILVKFGLKVLAKTKWSGLAAIMATAGINFSEKLPDTYTLGFLIAPRLNAAGRLEHASIALNLLMETDPVLAQQRAMALEQINKKRQELTALVLSEAREKALTLKDRAILVLAGEDWPKGVVGLVAGKIAEEFYKPTIVLSKDENGFTGSARTVGDFNILEAIVFASEFLERFGGHKQAAGLSLALNNLEKFYSKILEYSEQKDGTMPQGARLYLEAELGLSHLTLTFFELLSYLEPFGIGNPRPKFLIKDLKIEAIRAVGNLRNHLQFFLSNSQTKIPAIMFGATDFAKSLKIGDTIDAAAELLYDGYNGQARVKLRILDIKRTDLYEAFN